MVSGVIPISRCMLPFRRFSSLTLMAACSHGVVLDLHLQRCCERCQFFFFFYSFVIKASPICIIGCEVFRYMVTILFLFPCTEFVSHPLHIWLFFLVFVVSFWSSKRDLLVCAPLEPIIPYW
uniref:Uncharacterized protein n=1 Tax=Trypanosoma vivax (strain Y486) TaxID=1055687 RepID=G0U1X9_TRYVY|nr:hypothetical protein TVY486_0901020 [Trypanosoma vivax Y486]